MPASPLRELGVGGRVPTTSLGPMPLRRLAATALVLPGAGSLRPWRAIVDRHAEDIAAWDGRIHEADADGGALHRLLIVDRYRQIYAVHDAADAGELLGGHDLVEWFRFLATACPECGVLDQPVLTGPTP